MPTPTRRIDFVRAFLASALGTGLSRVLGAARDIAIASLLGATAASDAFWIAFTIPNLFRRFVADEGLTGALVPALARAESEDGPEATRRLGAAVLGALLVANLVLCGVGILAAEPMVLALAPSWIDEPEKVALTASMTRWLFPFVTMVSMVSWLEGMLNYRGHFFLPKIAPGLVSAGIVASALLWGSSFQEPAWSLVVGVLVGGVLHVLINLFPLFRKWGFIGVRFALTPRLRAVLIETSKVVVIGVFAQVNLIVLRQIATSLPSGSVTHYQNGTRIVDLAQGIVAVAIGSALLPNLSQAVQAADWDRFRSDLVGALRLAAFLLIPVAVCVGVLAEPITALLFRIGAYTAEDVEATAHAVRFLVPFVLALGGVNIVKRVFFALDDRATLLWVGGAGVALTGVLGWSLVGPLGVGGISLALSLATSAQLAAYVWVLHRRLGSRASLDGLAGPLALMCVAALPVGLVLGAVSSLHSFAGGPKDPVNWLVFLGYFVGAVGMYFALARLLGLPEVARLSGAITRRLKR